MKYDLETALDKIKEIANPGWGICGHQTKYYTEYGEVNYQFEVFMGNNKKDKCSVLAFSTNKEDLPTLAVLDAFEKTLMERYKAFYKGTL